MKKIGVIGSGTMGAGIIQVMAMGGFDVAFTDTYEPAIEKGYALIEKNLARMVKKEKATPEERDAILARISHSPDMSVVADADLVIEAIFEDVEVKKGLFKTLDELCKPETILATNTSAISITEIGTATKRPDQIIGIHFFNPAPMLELVEVIRGLVTSEETEAAVLELVKKIGKTSIRVEESPGFVVNRILTPLINEGISILADGIATAEDIDKGMRLGANHPMGPLELADLIGLDVMLSISETLYREFSDPKYAPHPLLRKMVRAGKLGRKSGIGFYDYRK
ncbi:MAG: 3-hydroxybutyryl-CoA dehydrogenase [Clostridiales Family XIII bacterium]|jgi:3-hydroxybutyryl-CoA dehydrogenase|nr:3-hydroxybutyryl-CoA dehydrogenase [Clostridiales Family XIII bacterium]